MTAKKPEVSLEPKGLTQKERADLVEAISEHTNRTNEAYKDAPNWEDAKPYIGLVGMLGFLSSPILDGRHLDHIRKMIAYDYVALPKTERKPRNTTAFLKEIRNQTGPEIAQVRKFKGEVDEMPPSFRDAFEDWDRMRDSLVTDRLMLGLRQSLRAIRQDR